MKIKLILFPLILISSYQFVYAQIDSIEYNYFEQIFDFELANNQYYFKMWDGEIIETDSLLFDADRYFANHTSDYISDYCDSVQFVIASRTLKKFYDEKILYNKQDDFIRLCFLRYEYPVILRFEELQNENIRISFKLGDGSFNWHGNVINLSFG